MRRIFLPICFGCLACFAQLPPGTPLWTNGFSTYGAAMMGVGDNGNIVIAGASDIRPSDYYMATYGPSGNLLRAYFYNGTANRNNVVRRLALDKNSTVYLTGLSQNANLDYDYVTLAISSSGSRLWTNTFNGSGGEDDIPSAITAAPNGNVLVTGVSAAGAGATNAATIAYSSGGIALWTNFYSESASSNAGAYAICADTNNNIYVAGSNGTNGGWAVVSYNASGTGRWTNHYLGPNSGVDVAYAVIIDPSGDVIAVGESTGVGTGFDFAIVKYSNSGTAIWTNRVNGPASGDDYPVGVAADAAGNVVVAGMAYGPGVQVQYLTVKYSPEGLPLWTNLFVGPIAAAMTMDSSGNVFVTGIDTTGVCSTVAYSAQGLPLWTNRPPVRPTPGAILPRITSDRFGNVYVVATDLVKYYSSARFYLGMQQLDSKAVLTWSNAGFNLQMSSGVGQAFTNVSGASSPYTNTAGAGGLFRLASPY